ncbi:hypothetical protein [Streptomyces durocortorensis]|uniref:hypothetical protein n=1 Tax=Streptomyces durocortorensis TaxID=2811104 RepID=UPI001EF57856|nr:hypothetical protein [Streptomyces durocortorensis]
MADLAGQVGDGDGDRRRVRITVEDPVPDLPAQATKSLDSFAGIMQPQSSKIRTREVPGAAARCSDSHHDGKELRVGSGQGQGCHVAEQRTGSLTLLRRQEERQRLRNVDPRAGLAGTGCWL